MLPLQHTPHSAKHISGKKSVPHSYGFKILLKMYTSHIETKHHNFSTTSPYEKLDFENEELGLKRLCMLISFT
jgi:hypothetical protein